MADLRLSEERNSDIRETDLNGDVIPGAIGTSATSSIDYDDDVSNKFPQMEEMLKVATDLQGGANVDDQHHATGLSPRLEFEDTGPSQPVWQPPPSYNDSTAMNQQPMQNSHYGPSGGTLVHPASGQKLETLKKWSISTYKCTRQYLSERLGKGTKTVDKEIEAQVLLLRETQVKYSQMLRLSKQMTLQFQAMLNTQKSLADAFTDLGMKSPELQDEFTYNSETQKSLVKNGEILLGALNFFNSNLETLVHKTMEDSVMTVKAYESARIEYDAYRSDLESIQTVQHTPTTAARVEDTKRQFETQRAKFDRLRGDLAVKLRFLEENKVKVMHKQLLLFNNAITAYFSGNKQALESCIKEFHIKMKAKEAEHSSFLEH